VSRAAVLSIVLTLSVGQYGLLLCGTWCHPQASAASHCHHQCPAMSPGMTGADGCATAVLNAAFLREDLQRGEYGSGQQHGVVVPRDEFDPSTTDRSPEPASVRLKSPVHRPLDTALRL